MPALTIKEALEQHKLSQSWLANAIKLSRASVNLIVNYGRYPVTPDAATVQQRIIAAFASNNIDFPKSIFLTTEVTDMSILMRKQPLSQAVLKAYGLFQSPFAADVRELSDVFAHSLDIQYAKESMYQAAKNGGFMALVGESGSGKSTLREYLQARCIAEQLGIVFVVPYVLGMSESDKQGQPLKATDIADAIIWALDPQATPRRSSQAKWKQMEQMLIEATSKTGGDKKVCLLLEEAHNLSKWVKKQLKRFWELKHGLTPLLGIILIGQPELKIQLSENDPSMREVVQRCELVELEPLHGNTHHYLALKFKRLGKNVNDVITTEAIDYLIKRLTDDRDKKHPISMTYPLYINNIIAKAMRFVTNNELLDKGKPMAIDKTILEEVLR